MATRTTAQSRVAARKQRDKWKAKRWFSIRAPRDPWQYKVIGETLGEDESFIIGRIYQITQQEFDGDFTKMHVKLSFRIKEVINQDAITEFIGHAHQNDHMRRQIRRYRGKVTGVIDVVTTDGYLVRLKPLVITERRVTTSTKHAMRRKATEVITSFVSTCTYAQLQKAILGDDLETSLRKSLQTINQLRSAVISKSELLQTGVVSDEGPTLDEIYVEESQAAAETKARKAAALAAAEDGQDTEEEPEAGVLDAAEAMESISEKVDSAATETTVEEKEVAAEVPTVESTLPSTAALKRMKKAELVELAEKAGVEASGTKDDIIAALEGA